MVVGGRGEWSGGEGGEALVALVIPEKQCLRILIIKLLVAVIIVIIIGGGIGLVVGLMLLIVRALAALASSAAVLAAGAHQRLALGLLLVMRVCGGGSGGGSMVRCGGHSRGAVLSLLLQMRLLRGMHHLALLGLQSEQTGKHHSKQNERKKREIAVDSTNCGSGSDLCPPCLCLGARLLCAVCVPDSLRSA